MEPSNLEQVCICFEDPDLLARKHIGYNFQCRIASNRKRAASEGVSQMPKQPESKSVLRPNSRSLTKARHPLAKQWHPTLNGSRTPSSLPVSSKTLEQLLIVERIMVQQDVQSVLMSKVEAAARR